MTGLYYPGFPQATLDRCENEAKGKPARRKDNGHEGDSQYYAMQHTEKLSWPSSANHELQMIHHMLVPQDTEGSKDTLKEKKISNHNSF